MHSLVEPVSPFNGRLFIELHQRSAPSLSQLSFGHPSNGILGINPDPVAEFYENDGADDQMLQVMNLRKFLGFF